MKKRYLIISIAIFLLLPIFAFAGPLPDKWVECKSSCGNTCGGLASGTCCAPNGWLTNSGVTKYCCNDGASYIWRDTNCCIDIDRDGYGNPGNAACGSGNAATDCDDNNANINPGILENTNTLCSDGLDNNCNSQIDCQDTGCKHSDSYYQTGIESSTTTESCYLRDYYCVGLVETYTDRLQYECGTCAYISASSCTGSAIGSCSFYSSSTQGPTLDQWAGGGNTLTAVCGSADNDANSEYRDYHCSGTSAQETYTVTQTKNCNSLDGWYGGGDNAGCGTDPNSIWNDYYVITNAGTCTSTTTCTGTGSVNCDSQDICANKCDGNIFISTPPMKDYYVVTNSNSCTSTANSPAREDCVAKQSTDTDGSSTAYITPGTVTNYVACSVSGCTSDTYSDSCSGTLLTEYGALGNSYTSAAYDCQNYETNYCTGDRYYRREWGCSGTPGYCNDATVPDTVAGTNADNDAKYKECGDGLCDNSPGVYDSTKTATETNCADSLDNDCDGKTDCADSDCAGKSGPGGVTCCQTASNCVQSNCKIESCASNQCSYANRPAGATDECGTCYACDTAGGNCAPQTANEGKNCAGTCTYCNAGACANRPAGATDECGTCFACNAAGGTCAAVTAETGKNCNTDCYDCVSGACNAKTENNDGSCSGVCTYCNAGTCSNRNQCAADECAAGQYCDAAGGNCQSSDGSSSVCLNCAASYGGDKTTGVWLPGNHEDKGIGWSANTEIRDYLFNSDGGNCVENDGMQCYDSSNNKVNHKSALATGSCCGDDANEWYKYDYYGGECTSDKNDCVWGSGGNSVDKKGDAQSSDTGNEKWWCYLHEWSECNDATIGAKSGGVTCAGVAGNNKWTPNSQVKTEDQYSCTDGKDNDGDSKIDCQDTDCAGTISGNVKDTNNANVQGAEIDALQNAVSDYTAYTNPLGNYQMNNVLCGIYDMVASANGYISSTKTATLPPKGSITVDFTGSSALVEGTTCEDDCTYAGDNTIHKECNNINGCAFFDQTAADVCNLAQPGWIRDYSQTQVVECAEGAPQNKIETKAVVTCEKGNLLKKTKVITYKGKLVKLNIVTCG